MNHNIASEEWIESAQLRLAAARFLLEEGFRSDRLTRAYFAVYHAMKALLASQDHKARTHKGVHMLAGKHFRDGVDTHFAHQLWDDREACDYELHVPSKEIVRERLARAARFLERAEALLD